MATITPVHEKLTVFKGHGRTEIAQATGQMAVRFTTGLMSAVTAEELGATLVKGATNDQISDAHKKSFDEWLNKYKTKVVGQADRYAQRLLAPQSGNGLSSNGSSGNGSDVAELIGEITEPTSLSCPGGYNAFDVISFSPIEVFAGPLMPRSKPDKILRGTNLVTPNVTIAAYLAVVFINPVPSTLCGFTVPPTIQLGGRTLRVGFDVMNITNVALGLSVAFNLTLPAPAPPLIFVPFLFRVPNVATAEINELNVTADIVESPQPYSAFATFHNDIDDEISIFGNVPVERQHDAPNRYMVYPF